MSDETRQKVYDAAKRWVADAEQPLEELIAAIKEHRTAERNEAGPTEPASTTSGQPSEPESSQPSEPSTGETETPADPPEAA